MYKTKKSRSSTLRFVDRARELAERDEVTLAPVKLAVEVVQDNTRRASEGLVRVVPGRPAAVAWHAVVWDGGSARLDAPPRDGPWRMGTGFDLQQSREG